MLQLLMVIPWMKFSMTTNGTSTCPSKNFAATVKLVQGSQARRRVEM
jgi:hypothetical protein